MINKNKITKKEKKELRMQKIKQDNIIRDEMNRRIEVLQIIYQLKENNYTSHYPAIKELLVIMDDYVRNGIKKEINIKFPEMNKVIKGVLPIYKDQECVVVLKHIE
jgi:hypothetical protein